MGACHPSPSIYVIISGPLQHLVTMVTGQGALGAGAALRPCTRGGVVALMDQVVRWGTATPSCSGRKDVR